MRLPGFVAEASLSHVTTRRRESNRTQARNSRLLREPVAPQQLRLEPRIPTQFFVSECDQRCQEVQQQIRMQCLGRCEDFVGAWSPDFDGCVRVCQGGNDFVSEDSGRMMPGPPQLKPGYCDARCLRAYRTPKFFSRREG
jgi:hypothetical protein